MEGPGRNAPALFFVMVGGAEGGVFSVLNKLAVVIGEACIAACDCESWREQEFFDFDSSTAGCAIPLSGSAVIRAVCRDTACPESGQYGCRER